MVLAWVAWGFLDSGSEVVDSAAGALPRMENGPAKFNDSETKASSNSRTRKMGWPRPVLFLIHNFNLKSIFLILESEVDTRRSEHAGGSLSSACEMF